ncbi:hypothetical protein ACOMHN_054519 [Nucella lapillus]
MANATGSGGGNLLTVDEGVRPRANSDPTVNTCCLLLPEIKVEDCTDADSSHSNPNHSSLPFGDDDPPRRRSNTCPEDLFRKRNGRPPTPPPSTFRKGHKFKSGFTKPVMKESVSFTHHKLSKLTESEDVEDPRLPCSRSAERLEEAELDRLPSRFREFKLQQPEKKTVGKKDRYPSEDSCPSQDCRLADGESSKKGGGVCDSSEDSFTSASSSVKCRCAQSNATTMDNKQLQAC